MSTPTNQPREQNRLLLSVPVSDNHRGEMQSQATEILGFHCKLASAYNLPRVS